MEEKVSEKDRNLGVIARYRTKVLVNLLEMRYEEITLEYRTCHIADFVAAYDRKGKQIPLRSVKTTKKQLIKAVDALEQWVMDLYTENRRLKDVLDQKQ
jgi:hypothetical protein